MCFGDGGCNSLCSVWIDIDHPFIFFMLWSIDFFFSNVCTTCLLLHLSKRKKKHGHMSSLSENEGDFLELIFIKTSAPCPWKRKVEQPSFSLVGGLSGEEAGLHPRPPPSTPSSEQADISRVGPGPSSARGFTTVAQGTVSSLQASTDGSDICPTGRCLKTQKITYGEATTP